MMKTENAQSWIDALSTSPALAKVCRSHGIRLMVLFGSHTRGFARPESDYDIAVEFKDERKMDWQNLWEDLIPHFPSDRIDLVELGKAPPLLAWSVATKGRALYDADGRHWNRFRKWAVKEFEDVRHFDRYRLRRIDSVIQSST